MDIAAHVCRNMDVKKSCYQRMCLKIKITSLKDADCIVEENGTDPEIYMYIGGRQAGRLVNHLLKKVGC